jgi:hypothetical protein
LHISAKRRCNMAMMVAAQKPLKQYKRETPPPPAPAAAPVQAVAAVADVDERESDLPPPRSQPRVQREPSPQPVAANEVRHRAVQPQKATTKTSTKTTTTSKPLASSAEVQRSKHAVPSASQLDWQRQERRRPAHSTCALCHFALSTASATVGFTQLECTHTFHTRCLAVHFRGTRATCPVCFEIASTAAAAFEDDAGTGAASAAAAVADLVPVDFGDDCAAARYALLHQQRARDAAPVPQRAAAVGADEVLRMTNELISARAAAVAASSAASPAAPSFFARFVPWRSASSSPAVNAAAGASPTNGVAADIAWARDSAVQRPTQATLLPRGGTLASLTLDGAQFDALVRHAPPRELLDDGVDAAALLGDDRISAQLLVAHFHYSLRELAALGFEWRHLVTRLGLGCALLRSQRQLVSPHDLAALYGVTVPMLVADCCNGDIDAFVSLRYELADLLALGATAATLAACGLRLVHMTQPPLADLTLDQWLTALQLSSVETLRTMQLTPGTIQKQLRWDKQRLEQAVGSAQYTEFLRDFIKSRTTTASAPASTAPTN